MSWSRRGPLVPVDLEGFDDVTTRLALTTAGLTNDAIRAQLAAQRWRQLGKAVVLHNGPITVTQRHRIILINCGPRAVLTSFTCAAERGLKGWKRPTTHVLAPAGTTRPPIRGLVLHRVGDWRDVDVDRHRRQHALAPSLVIAASSFKDPDPACGLLAAAVQQRLVRPNELRLAVLAASRTRHRHALLLALGDIEQGAEALSEIRLGRICRRFRLPPPSRQSIRVEPDGTRRYLDAEWDLPGGGLLAVEIDGAYHRDVRQQDRDDVRQNHIVIGGTTVLRFSSNLVRHHPEIVAGQLRAVLRPPRW